MGSGEDGKKGVRSLQMCRGFSYGEEERIVFWFHRFGLEWSGLLYNLFFEGLPVFSIVLFCLHDLWYFQHFLFLDVLSKLWLSKIPLGRSHLSFSLVLLISRNFEADETCLIQISFNLFLLSVVFHPCQSTHIWTRKSLRDSIPYPYCFDTVVNQLFCTQLWFRTAFFTHLHTIQAF